MVGRGEKSGRAKLKAKARLLNVRLTEDEYSAVSKAADNAGMTLSAFFRSLVLEGAGVLPIFNHDDRAALALLHEDMRKIGVNLNQVARAINSGRVVDAGEVKIALNNVLVVASGASVELRSAAKRAGQRRRGGE